MHFDLLEIQYFRFICAIHAFWIYIENLFFDSVLLNTDVDLFYQEEDISLDKTVYLMKMKRVTRSMPAWWLSHSIWSYTDAIFCITLAPFHCKQHCHGNGKHLCIPEASGTSAQIVHLLSNLKKKNWLTVRKCAPIPQTSSVLHPHHGFTLVISVEAHWSHIPNQINPFLFHTVSDDGCCITELQNKDFCS